MIQRNIFITALICLLCANLLSINAQDEKKSETPYWYVVKHQLSREKLDSLLSLVKNYDIPGFEEVKKAGGLLDYKVLINHTGDEYNVVVMSKFPSWHALNESAGWRAALEIIEPDEAKRKKVLKTHHWIFSGGPHISYIYSEATHKMD